MQKQIICLAALVAMLVNCPAVFADYDRKEGFARVSRGAAHRIALSQVRGYVQNSDLDFRQGRLRWKVQVRDPYYGQKSEIFIDAMTGAIVGVKIRG